MKITKIEENIFEVENIKIKFSTQTRLLLNQMKVDEDKLIEWFLADRGNGITIGGGDLVRYLEKMGGNKK